MCVRRLILCLALCAFMLVGCGGGSPTFDDLVADACDKVEAVVDERDRSLLGATGYVLYVWQEAQEAGYSGDVFLEEMEDHCPEEFLLMMGMWRILRTG